MRILHVVPGLRPAAGGPSRAIPALCAALSASGHQVEIYTFSPRGTHPAESYRTAVPVRYFESLGNTLEFPTILFYRELRRVVAGFDIVHLHGVWNPAITLAAHVCRSRKKSYVLTPMGMLRTIALQRRGLKKYLYRRVLDQHTIASAGAVIAFTRLEANEASDSGLGGPLQVIPNGMDIAVVENIESGRFIENFPVLRNKVIVLFLGRLHWSKNLPLQFEAMQSVLRKRPDAMWVLVGPDDGEWANLRKQVQDQGLEGRVLWTGLLSQAQCLQALKDSHVALLTSRHEGHSMAMNEALAIGVPIVLTDSVGFDHVRSSGTGLVVAEKPSDISAAVLRILNEPELARNMRRAGPALVQEHYTWATVARQHVDLYQQVLETNTQRFTQS